MGKNDVMVLIGVDGWRHAINPTEVVRIAGRGRSWAVHFRNGISYATTTDPDGMTVDEVVTLWAAALDSWGCGATLASTPREGGDPCKSHGPRASVASSPSSSSSSASSDC